MRLTLTLHYYMTTDYTITAFIYLLLQLQITSTAVVVLLDFSRSNCVKDIV